MQYSWDINQIGFTSSSSPWSISAVQNSFNLPRCNNEKVHKVPGVPHIASFVKHESKSKNFCTHLSSEHHHKDNLKLFLKVLKTKLAIILYVFLLIYRVQNKPLSHQFWTLVWSLTIIRVHKKEEGIKWLITYLYACLFML